MTTKKRKTVKKKTTTKQSQSQNQTVNVNINSTSKKKTTKKRKSNKEPVGRMSDQMAYYRQLNAAPPLVVQQIPNNNDLVGAIQGLLSRNAAPAPTQVNTELLPNTIRDLESISKNIKKIKDIEPEPVPSVPAPSASSKSTSPAPSKTPSVSSKKSSASSLSEMFSPVKLIKTPAPSVSSSKSSSSSTPTELKGSIFLSEIKKKPPSEEGMSFKSSSSSPAKRGAVERKKILNPETGNYILADGKKAKDLKSKGII